MRLPLVLLLALVAAMPALAQAPPERTLTPSVVRVGKWAEGIASDGKSLWVAESGQRSIVQIAGNGTIQRRVTVGRLPVRMASLPDGRIHVLLHTDQIVWQLAPGADQGRALKWIAEYPTAMAADAKALWVLTWPDMSSMDSRVILIDPDTGAQRQTGKLGPGGEAIATGHGRVWATHVSGGRLSIVDPQTLAAEHVTLGEASLWAIVANRTGLFAGGRIGEDNARGLILSLDPKTGAEIARLPASERIAVLAADDETLAAIGEKGTIWIVATKDFTLRSTIKLGTGTYRPGSALIHDGKLVVVAQQYQGENGAVFTLTDWR